MQTIQQRTTARLLRHVLEAVVPSKNRVIDAVADRVADALPAGRDGKLYLRDTDVDQGEYAGSDRRRPCYPSTRRFDPYRELFTFRRVVTPPWDTAWRSTPLVLRDVDLLHAVDFAPYLEAEPHEHGETVTKILEHHRGPVGSLRVDASALPPPEMLGRWLDLLSAGGVAELILLDVGAPPARGKEAVDFPLNRLRCAGLATLALGFVRVRFGWCSGLSGLEALFLVSCRCSGRDISEAVAHLDHLKTVGIFAMDLAGAGAGAAASAGGDGVLDILSDSISSLELMETTATALRLLHAPGLKNLVAGVVPPEVKNQRVWPWMERARPPVSISLQHAQELQSIRGLVLWRRQRISLGTPLANVETLEVALEMAVAEQWGQLLMLAAQLPQLRCLDLTRVDDRRVYEELDLEPHPPCFRESLRELRLHDYRAGDAEVCLVTDILATAEHLLSVILYPHPSVSTYSRHVDFSSCERLSAAVQIQYSC